MPHMASSMLGVKGQLKGKVKHFSSKYREGTREDGGRYDKQGSAYEIRINREEIHRKDRGRGRERKGEGREGGVKGKERRGKGGDHEEGTEGTRKGGERCNQPA